MKRIALLTSMLLATAGLLAGAAQADPSTVLTYSFTGCTGPAPSSFDAVREERASGSGFRLTSGEAIFVVLVFRDLVTGTAFSPPGIDVSGVATVTCMVESPISGDTLQLSGFLAPR